MNKIKSISLFVLPFIFLSSCTSLENVRKYGTSIHATVAEVEPVAKDFRTSCMRANAYKLYKNSNDCHTERKASLEIMKVAKVLDTYGAALSALSSDELANYNTDIKNLTNEINNINIKDLAPEKVSAIGDLANLFADIAIKRYQQRQVAAFISDCNDAVVMVSNTLADMIDKNYLLAIDIEISAWKDGCEKAEGDRNKNYVGWVDFSREQWKYRMELEEKRDAAKNLAESIRNIGETHAKIKKDANNLSSKEVAAAVSYFMNEAKPVIREVEDAF